MTGTVSGVIVAIHTASGIVLTISVSFASASATAAQTTLTTIENYITGGGATIQSNTCVFTPQTTQLT